MPNVPPTTLTTDTPGSGELNLNDGFAIFPWMGSIQAGTNLGKGSGTFLDKTVSFEFLKIYCGIFHSTFIGICGPSYACDADTDASTSYTIPADPQQGGTGTLVIQSHDLRGGFQYGIDFQIDFNVEIFANLVVTKKKLVDVDAGIDINVINLIIALIEYLLAGNSGGQDEASGNPNDLELSTFSSDSSGSVEQMSIEEGTNSATSSGGNASGSVDKQFSGAGMVDYIPSPWLPSANGQTSGAPAATLVPQIGFDLNIVPLFAEIPGLDILSGFNEALSNFGGSFGLGPGLAVGFPVTVTLEGATIDNHPFTISSATATGPGNTYTSMPLTEQTPVSPNLQPLKDPPDEIGLLLKHEVGIQLDLYFFIEMTFLEVFFIGAQTGDLPLITVPLPPAAGGPFHNQLSFIPGGGVVPFTAPDTAPTVGPYTANQPQGRWKDGVLARYGISFFNSDYESPIGPFSAYDPQQRFFAFPQLSNIEAPLDPDNTIQGRNVYRQFNDGSEPELVGTINDDTTTTFYDNKP
jgi:hypothetical protein